MKIAAKTKIWMRRLVIAAAMVVLLLAGGRYWVMNAALKHMALAPQGQSIGPDDAAVTIVEFLDYRCPACRTAHNGVLELHRLHPEVRIVFRPIPAFGEESMPGIGLALAAGINGKFMEMHEILITREDPVRDEDIDALARQVGLTPDGLRMDMVSGAVTKEMLVSALAAEALEVKGTPSFTVNGVLLNPMDGEDASVALERAIAAAQETSQE